MPKSKILQMYSCVCYKLFTFEALIEDIVHSL